VFCRFVVSFEKSTNNALNFFDLSFEPQTVYKLLDCKDQHSNNFIKQIGHFTIIMPTYKLGLEVHIINMYVFY
jgi:hypothetical protein